MYILYLLQDCLALPAFVTTISSTYTCSVITTHNALRSVFVVYRHSERESERERERERERESINLVNKKRGHMSLRELKVDRKREKESERVRNIEIKIKRNKIITRMTSL